MREVIVPLDFPNGEQTLAFLRKLNDAKAKPYVKIGLELFYAEGASIVHEIAELGYKIFLDLKLHDIPNTVRGAARSLANLPVSMVNVHASGGVAMMKTALEGFTRRDGSRPIVIGVTLLTSIGSDCLANELGISSKPDELAERLARSAFDAGLDGVVCSPNESARIKTISQDFLTVCPGIREGGSVVSSDDQARTATPAQARAMLCDYIVVGRPITKAVDPLAAYERIMREFAGR